MNARKRVAYFWLIVTLTALSCDVSTFVPQQSIPTSEPGLIDTIVVQTAAAASTQTAALIPPTLTPSMTRLPTKTPTITPTDTPTFIFKLKTPTKPPSTRTPTPTKKSSGGGGGGGGGGGSGGGGGGSTATWSCQLTSQSPTNSTHFAPSTPFSMNWTVKNTSSETWLATSVDVTFLSGTNLASGTLFDTTSNTSVGSSYVVTLSMQSPAGSGTYTSNWSLLVGKTLFCPMSITINVP